MAATVHQMMEAAYKALKVPVPGDLGPKAMLERAHRHTPRDRRLSRGEADDDKGIAVDGGV